MPKSSKQEIEIHKVNGDTVWWQAALEKTNNMIISFKLYGGNVEDIPTDDLEMGYHIIFYVKMGYNVRRKYQIEIGGRNTPTLSSLNCF